MNIIVINKNRYYLADDLMKTNPSLFKGCRTSRIFITKNDIPKSKYTFAKQVKDVWIETDGSSARYDKVMIRKLYFDEEYLKDHVEPDTKKYDPVPPIIELKESEKFYNGNKNPVKIEVVGERKFDGCYFKVKDIMYEFSISRLNDTITNKEYDGYVEGKHYVYFNMQDPLTQGKCKRELYVTYRGMLRILFASRQKTVDKFVDWATDTLFAAQMGTPKQKINVASNILGIPSKSVRDFLYKTSDIISCIYLIFLGTVKELREKLNLDEKLNDDDLVNKFGATEDIKRRIGELETDYKNIKSGPLELILFSQIDQENIFKAETKIKKIFKFIDKMITHEKYIELVVIKKKDIKMIKEIYGQISSKFSNQVKDLKIYVTEKDDQIALIKKLHKKELSEKDDELSRKDNDLLRKENKLLRKDNELIKERHEKELLKKDLKNANHKLSKKKSLKR